MLGSEQALIIVDILSVTKTAQLREILLSYCKKIQISQIHWNLLWATRQTQTQLKINVLFPGRYKTRLDGVEIYLLPCNHIFGTGTVNSRENKHLCWARVRLNLAIVTTRGCLCVCCTGIKQYWGALMCVNHQEAPQARRPAPCSSCLIGCL